LKELKKSTEASFETVDFWADVWTCDQDTDGKITLEWF
jgi:hypothetical protein